MQFGSVTFLDIVFFLEFLFSRQNGYCAICTWFSHGVRICNWLSVRCLKNPRLVMIHVSHHMHSSIIHTHFIGEVSPTFRQTSKHFAYNRVYLPYDFFVIWL